MRKLNLGSGKDILKGYINLDIVELEGVDVVWDLTKIPLPFKDNEFDEVLCQDILEHVPLIETLRELHRITKKKGIIKIRVPHFTSLNNYVDPTHINRFSILTFDFFIANHSRNYYVDFTFEKILSRKITFYYFYKLLAPIINLNTKTQKIYEMFSVCYLWQGLNIEVTLKK